MSPLRATIARNLAPAAAIERDQRLDAYPALILAGRITREAALADTQAWIEIEHSLAAGLPGLTVRDWCDWIERETATAEALRRRRAAEARHPDDYTLRLRRENVEAIHNLISHEADRIRTINHIAREMRAERLKEAA